MYIAFADTNMHRNIHGQVAQRRFGYYLCMCSITVKCQTFASGTCAESDSSYASQPEAVLGSGLGSGLEAVPRAVPGSGSQSRAWNQCPEPYLEPRPGPFGKESLTNLWQGGGPRTAA